MGQFTQQKLVLYLPIKDAQSHDLKMASLKNSPFLSNRGNFIRNYRAVFAASSNVEADKNFYDAEQNPEVFFFWNKCFSISLLYSFQLRNHSLSSFGPRRGPSGSLTDVLIILLHFHLSSADRIATSKLIPVHDLMLSHHIVLW